MGNDVLTVEYEEFNEDGIKVLSVSRNDEVIWMFHDKQAEAVHNLLTGDIDSICLARDGRLIWT